MTIHKKENWMKTGWRPALSWAYVAICLFDFILGPVLFNILQYLNAGQQVSLYQAITLQGGGLFHLSMGAIIGISTHGRTQEKIKGVDASLVANPIAQTLSSVNPASPSSFYSTDTYVAPIAQQPIAPTFATAFATTFDDYSVPVASESQSFYSKEAIPVADTVVPVVETQIQSEAIVTTKQSPLQPEHPLL